MFIKLRKLLKKYKAPVLYIVFGGITTVINILTYYMLYEMAHLGNDVSNIISWIVTVTAAYVTNKIWVFESREHSVRVILYEMAAFYACRIATGVLDFAIMHVGVVILNYAALPLKVASNIIVIILNYAASKLFIFRKKDGGNG